ncbi:MAG: lipid II flippase MurJ [bacterium]
MNSKFLKQSFVAASIITIGTNVLGRIFGYAREAVVAGYFGTSAAFDAFLIAFTIPEIITFIIFAAIPPALIPFIKKYSYENEQEESQLFAGSFVSFAIIFALLSVLVFVLKKEIIWFLAPTLTGSDYETALRLMPILAPFIFFRGMEGYFRAELFNKKHFVIPAISPMIINIFVLAIILLAYDKFNIFALAYGWLIASFALFIINGFVVFSIEKRFSLNKINPGLILKLLKIVGAVAFVECIALLYPVVDRFLASRYLGEGQIAALRYATFLIHLPTGMFVVSFAMASFPWISDFSAPVHVEKFKKLYNESLGLIIFLMSFVAAAVILFPSEIVSLALQRGAFDNQSMILTSGPLKYFAMGIVFYSVYIFQMRFYYARSELSKLSLYLMFMLVIKITFSLLLIERFEQNGLAMATSIAWLVGFVLMSWDLGKRLKINYFKTIIPQAAKILIVLIFTIVSWLLLDNYWPVDSNYHFVQTLLRFTVIICSGGILFLLISLMLKLQEPKIVLSLLRSKLFKNES